MKYGFFVHYVPAVTVDSSGKTVMDPDAIADAFGVAHKLDESR